MQSISLSTKSDSNQNTKSDRLQARSSKISESASIVFGSEFEWDNILDESFTKGFIDDKGNLI